MLKKILLTIVIGSFGVTKAQLFVPSGFIAVRLHQYNLGIHKIELSYDQIEGSPYANKEFKQAKIAEKYRNENVRLNIDRDDVEFLDGEKIMVLPKTDEFSRIKIIPNNEVLVYKDLDADAKKGYYYELVMGKVSLFKKLELKFSNYEPAQTSFKNVTPATFFQVPPSFFIEKDGKVLKNPKREKEIISLFPDKKNELNKFFNQNRIRLSKEEDLIKLVAFLNQ